MQNEVTKAGASTNEARGFYGAIEQHAEPNQAWALAVAWITKSTGRCDQAVRDFLDSRYGRHFADEAAVGLCGGRDLPRAIDEAIERWMDRRIDAAIESELGIPEGLPYLTQVPVFSSQPGRLGQVDPEPLPPPLIAARHLRRGVAELALHERLLDVRRRGETGP